MKINYTSLQVGDFLLLIPKGKATIIGMYKRILWSHSDVENMFFGAFSFEYFMMHFICENSKSLMNLKKVSLLDKSIYSENFLNSLKTLSLFELKLAYEYRNEIASLTDGSFFQVDNSWNNNTRNLFSIKSLNKHYHETKSKKLSMMYSVYEESTPEFLEDTLSKILKCENKNVAHTIAEWKSEVKFADVEFSDPVVIDEGYTRYVFHKSGVYFGLLYVNKNILVRVDWEYSWKFFVDVNNYSSIPVSIGKKLCSIFEHRIMNDYNAQIGNNIYSVFTQVIGMFPEKFPRGKKDHWKRLMEIYPDTFCINLLERYTEEVGGVRNYIQISGLNDKYETIWEKQVDLKKDNDYIILNKEEITNWLYE